MRKHPNNMSSRFSTRSDTNKAVGQRPEISDLGNREIVLSM